MEPIVQWLEGLGPGQYGEAFARADIDLAVLPDLGEADLAQLGVTLGHRKRLLRAIAGLVPEPASPIAHAEDAVQEALGLWVERERRRAEILAAVDTAQASIDRGEGLEITQQSMRELSEDVKRRGRARVAAQDHTAPR